MATAPNFGAATVPGLNPITSQIPNYAQQAMLAQRQQAIAQALTQDGMAPIDYDPRGRISWTQGLAKMLQAYTGAKLANQSINSQAGLQQQGMQAMGQAYGMSAPQGDQQALASALSPQAASAAQQAMSQGAQQGSVGPTTANASRMDAMQPAPAAPVASAPAPGMGGVKTPLNPYGAPAMLAWQAGQGDASAMEAYKTFLANQTATPEMKNSAYMGQTPAQMLANTQGKAVKDAQIEYKPGEFTTNPITGQDGFYPKLPEYSQPAGPVASNGYVGGVAPVRGAIPTAAATSGAVASADAGGRFPYQTTTVLDASGNPTVATNGQVFPGVGGGGGVPRSPVAGPAPVQTGAPQPGVPPVAQPPAQPALTRRTALSATTTNLLGQGGDLLKNAQADQSGNRQAGQFLDEIDALSKSGAKFGPGTDQVARWKALAGNYIPGIDLSGAQTNQDVIRKIAANLAGARGTRSDADLQNWQKAYPSGELTNDAIAKVIPMLRQTLAVSDARANVLTRASSTGLDKLPDAANKFNQIASPSLVAEGQALANASKNGTVPQFMQQYQKHYPDWKSRLGQIQQLDGMGAF